MRTIKWLAAVFIVAVTVVYCLTELRDAWSNSTITLEAGDRTRLFDKTIDDFWFTPSGSLVLISYSDRNVTSRIWQPDAGAAAELRQDAGLTDLIGGKKLRYATSHLPLTAPDESVPFTISRDGLQIAWAYQSNVRIAPFKSGLQESDVSSLEIRPVGVKALSFLGDDSVLVIYTDGKVEDWGLTSRRFERGTWVDSGWQLWPSHPWFALTSFRTGDVGYLGRNSEDGIGFEFGQLTPEEGTVVAVSPNGRLVVGTSSGSLKEFVPRTEESQTKSDLKNIADLGPGRVLSAAFYDDERLLAGTQEGGLFLVQGRSQRNLSQAGSVHKIETSRTHVAVLTNAGLERLPVVERREWPEHAYSGISIALGIAGFLLAVIAILNQR